MLLPWTTSPWLSTQLLITNKKKPPLGGPSSVTGDGVRLIMEPFKKLIRATIESLNRLFSRDRMWAWCFGPTH